MAAVTLRLPVIASSVPARPTRADEISLRVQSHLLLIAGLVPAIQSLGLKRRLDCWDEPGNEGEK
jgi:hypothetical protein